MTYQIAVDVGGTFTDGVMLEAATDTIWVAKALTTPADPGKGIARVIEMLLEQLPASVAEGRKAVHRVVHGTTLITNTLLERKGVKTALVVTAGTEDVLDIRRETRYDTYDLEISFPEPLVERGQRFPLAERIGPAGENWKEIDEAELKQLAERLAREDVAAVAICFLHSCVDGRHERRVRDALRQTTPQRSYSISSEVAAEIGEYERMSTVAANAYVQPIVEHYMNALGRRLTELGLESRLDIMVSNGGFTEAEQAGRFPIRLLESGPAGGVLSAINCAAIHQVKNILAFDMGGTTAKSCVAVDGVPAITHTFEFARVRRFRKGSGLPAVSPSIDLIEIGAGGGSIARVSTMGLLQVGPESASAEPGPACYDLGGSDATVTDSDLFLGHLDADNFLGGRMRLSLAKAEQALADLGQRLGGMSAETVAWGIHDIVNENMAAAARTHIAERGHDARHFTLVTTGGAGPVHAVDVARRLRIARVLCPVASGVGSCLGFLAAPARADQSWSKLEAVDLIDWPDLGDRLEAARSALASDLSHVGIAAGDIQWHLCAEMRYQGQGAKVEVDLGDIAFEALNQTLLQELFLKEYIRLFKRPVPGGKPEVVTWRVVAQSRERHRRYAFPASARRQTEAKASSTRRLYLPGEKKFATAPVYDRHQLPPDATLAGPLVVVEPESTLVVAYPATVTVLGDGTLEVVLKGDA